MHAAGSRSQLGHTLLIPDTEGASETSDAQVSDLLGVRNEGARDAPQQ